MTSAEVAAHNARIYRARMAAARRNMLLGCNYSKYSAPAMMDAMPEKAIKALGLGQMARRQAASA